MEYPNVVEFEVYGDYALFSDPLMRVSGERCSYQIPTYEALKGILASIYWKPTLIWYIDEVRIMNPIRMTAKGIRTLKYAPPKKKGVVQAADLSYYTYLRDCRYQVRAHFVWNENRPELANDRNENKHHNIAKRMIEKGGRRDIFLGTRDCQAYVEPCVFGEGKGAYDDLDELSFGPMYHGITYPDEAYSADTSNCATANFWMPVMKNGIITFLKPQDCPWHKKLGAMPMKKFGSEENNFSGLDEFTEDE